MTHMKFTHKWRGTWGTQEDMDTVVRVFDFVKSWSDRNNIPVYLGEFAVMAYADRTSRVKWYDFISDAALERGLHVPYGITAFLVHWIMTWLFTTEIPVPLTLKSSMHYLIPEHIRLILRNLHQLQDRPNRP